MEKDKVISASTIFPIEKGGTGASTKETALQNLGLTANASELNILDGATISTEELNHLDGVTSNIQTQLNTIPTKYAGSSSKGGAATTALACSGNAATATKLAASKTIKLTGDVTGSATFDGSADASITATVADNSHNHSASNITSGTLPIARGGTGATTAAAALTNLGISNSIKTGTYTGSCSNYGYNQTVNLGCSPKWVFFFPLISGSSSFVDGKFSLGGMTRFVKNMKDYSVGKWGNFSGDYCQNTDANEWVGFIAAGQTLKMDNGVWSVNSRGEEESETYATYDGPEKLDLVVANLNGSTLTVGCGKYELTDTSYTGSNADTEKLVVQYAKNGTTYGWIAGL